MKKFNKFLYGFIIGLVLPILFIWIYLSTNYPNYDGFGTVLKILSPDDPITKILFAKTLSISILPNLMLTFVFYKTDSFKLASGIMMGGIPFLIASIFLFA